MMQFDQMQKLTRDGMDVAMRSLGAVSTGTQAAAAQTADYAKRSLEQGSHMAERLMGSRTLDAALQVQAEFLRASYEGLVSQATRMGELASNTAKEALAPVESFAARSTRSA
ncbi:phasin family protein [uncultured Enterovirga sp.]|uniref:phasin family protein n=1 Tax=uncultured Enterovirga sp. TaxID=2026352 RepID=UPI0035CC8FCA